MSDRDLDSLGAVLPLPYRIGALLTAGMSLSMMPESRPRAAIF